MPSGAKKRKAAKRKQQKGGAHVDAPANSQEGNSGRDEDDRSSHGEIETLTPLEGSDSKYSSDPNNTMEEAANGGPAVEGDLPPVPNPSENVRVEFVQSVDIVNGQDESSSESSSDDDQRSGEVTTAERGLEISGDESLCEEAATPKGVVAENETFGVTQPVVGVESENCVATPDIPVTESEEIPATPFIESEEVVILETPIIEAEGAAIPATPATPFVEAEGVAITATPLVENEGVAITATPLVENEGVAIPATPFVEAEGVAIPATPFVEAESSAIPFVEAEGVASPASPATPVAEAEGVAIPATPATPETPFIESEEVVTPVTPVTPVIESEGAVNSTLKEIEEKINSSPKIPSEKPRDVHFPQDLENLDRTDNEINSAPLPVQTTSWKGCCGLLELLGVSNR